MKEVKTPEIFLFNDDLIVHSIASAIRFEETKNNNLPSRILSLAGIYIKPEHDSWQKLEYRFKHPCLWQKIEDKDLSFETGIFQIKYIEEIFINLQDYIPTFELLDPLDWPFCFATKLALAANKEGLTPKETLELFCIHYLGETEDDWGAFRWDFIETKRVLVDLRKEGMNEIRH